MFKTQAAVATSATESAQPGNRPSRTLHVGSITTAIWRNAGQKGDFYSVTFGRSYKESDQWKHSDSYGRDDLLLLAKAAGRAHDRILELHRESGKN